MSNTTESQKTKEDVIAFFNGDRTVLPKSEWKGAELRQFFDVPSQNQLFKEERGKNPDTLVKPEDDLTVKNGDKFFDLPVGVKG